MYSMIAESMIERVARGENPAEVLDELSFESLRPTKIKSGIRDLRVRMERGAFNSLSSLVKKAADRSVYMQKKAVALTRDAIDKDIEDLQKQIDAAKDPKELRDAEVRMAKMMVARTALRNKCLDACMAT